MALTYTGTTGLFTHLGKLVKHYNQLKTDATDGSTGLDADRDEILDAFQAADQDVAINGLVSSYERWKSEYVGRRGELAAYALKRLQDRVSVLDEIGATSIGQSEIISKLIEAMDEDTASVAASSVSIGSVNADVDNAGGGTILTTNVLDGATSPGATNGVSVPSQVYYDGLTTELCPASQKHRFRVVADSFHDDVEEGSEEIAWEGTVPDQPHGITGGGSGYIATILPIHAATSGHLLNADFEDGFTGGVPDNWDLVGGVGNTNVKAAGSADADHGVEALLLQGDASATSIEIKQTIDKANVVGRKRYCVSARVKKTSATTGSLTIQFEGTGYTAGGSEKISQAVSGLGTSYALHHFFVTLPARIPNDFRLVIRWDGGTPGGSEKVFVDDIGFGAVNYGGGIGVVAVRNSAPFVREDRYDVTVTNTEGVFQSFFRRVFGAQLPSDPAMPTLADSLAQ
ncbi:MAG TPA: hypothetical protein VMM76_19205 [Pirellulaceae bacterium]|nr:hypothetical protein [Pirellulaceae bacterium]